MMILAKRAFLLTLSLYEFNVGERNPYPHPREVAKELRENVMIKQVIWIPQSVYDAIWLIVECTESAFKKTVLDSLPQYLRENITHPEQDFYDKWLEVK